MPSSGCAAPLSVSYYDEVWFRLNEMSESSALSYFQQSPFYDPSCNNEYCRMQGVAPDRLASVLRTLKGVEYSVHQFSRDPTSGGFDLCVIEKRQRSSAEQTTPLSYFYIDRSGHIFQAPDVQAVLSSRLEKVAFFLSEARRLLRIAEEAPSEATDASASGSTLGEWIGWLPAPGARRRRARDPTEVYGPLSPWLRRRKGEREESVKNEEESAAWP